MIYFRNTQIFKLVAILLLAGLAAFSFHFLIHAHHHQGDKDDDGQCPVCHFIAVLGFVLLCFFAIFFRPQKEYLTSPIFAPVLGAGFLSPHYGRAPPVLS